MKNQNLEAGGPCGKAATVVCGWSNNTNDNKDNANDDGEITMTTRIMITCGNPATLVCAIIQFINVVVVVVIVIQSMIARIIELTKYISKPVGHSRAGRMQEFLAGALWNNNFGDFQRKPRGCQEALKVFRSNLATLKRASTHFTRTLFNCLLLATE